MHQAWSANVYTSISDMFPKHLVGTVTGIGGMAGSVGGMLLAFFAGRILDWFGKDQGYSILFIICGSSYTIAWIIFNLLTREKKSSI